MLKQSLLVAASFVVGVTGVLAAGMSGAGGFPADDQGVPWLAVPALLGAGVVGALLSATIPGWIAAAGGVAVGDFIGLTFAAGMAYMYSWSGWYGTRGQIVASIGLVLATHLLALTAGFVIVAAVRHRSWPAWSLRRRLLVAAPVAVFAAMAGLTPLYVAGSLPDNPRLKVDIGGDLSVTAQPADLPGREIEIDFGDYDSPVTLIGIPLQNPDDLEVIASGPEVSTITLGDMGDAMFHRQSLTLPATGWYAVFATNGSTTPPAEVHRYAVIHIAP